MKKSKKHPDFPLLSSYKASYTEQSTPWVGLLPTEIHLFSPPSASNCLKFVTLQLWIVNISFIPKQGHRYGDILLTNHSKKKLISISLNHI